MVFPLRVGISMWSVDSYRLRCSRWYALVLVDGKVDVKVVQVERAGVLGERNWWERLWMEPATARAAVSRIARTRLGRHGVRCVE